MDPEILTITCIVSAMLISLIVFFLGWQVTALSQNWCGFGLAVIAILLLCHLMTNYRQTSPSLSAHSILAQAKFSPVFKLFLIGCDNHPPVIQVLSNTHAEVIFIRREADQIVFLRAYEIVPSRQFRSVAILKNITSSKSPFKKTFLTHLYYPPREYFYL